MKTTLKETPISRRTANEYSRAAISARFIGPTNTRPARIKVTTQRGSKTYGYHNAPGDAGTDQAYNWALSEFLAVILAEDVEKYGPEAKGWGVLSDYAVGVTSDGVRVYVQIQK